MGLKAILDVVEKSRQCTCDIILWGVCETYVAVDITAMHSLYVVELHVTANCSQILSVAQHFFYVRLLSPANLNTHWSTSKVPNTALRQKECLFVRSLHYICSLTKQTVMTDKLLAVPQFL